MALARLPLDRRAIGAWLRRGGWVPTLIVLMGLAPLFWAPWDIAFLTEDSALPRLPTQLPLTLHSWNPLLNTGTHYNVAHTTLLIFAPEAFLQWLGLGAALTQRLMGVALFTLPGLAIYALVRAILGRDGWTLRGQGVAIVAASFYMFNLYLENVWLSFNMSVLTAQATLPALLALLIHAFDGRLTRRRFVLLLAPVALWASSVGVNPPMTLVFLGTLAAFVLGYGLLHGAWRRPALARRMAATLGLGLVVALPLNAFWILPFVEQIRGTGGAEVTAVAELASQWLTGVSNQTSFANVLRLQGAWTWYQGWQEPYRPWAETFRTNGALGALAWVAAGLALVGALAPGPRIRHLFTAAAVGGLLLSMGTHEPMDGVYLWLVDHIPGFWIIRSPWFKFTLITALGFSVLMGLGAGALATWISRAPPIRAIGRRIARATLVAVPLLVVGANLAYAYPLTTGRMFLPEEAREFLPHNHVRVPPAARASAEWFDAQGDDLRVAMLPETTVWATDWGYNGFFPSLVQLGTTPVVFSFNAVFGSLVAPANAGLNEVAYRAIYRVSTRRADEIFKLMSVAYLNHATDVKYWLYAGDTDSPEWIRERLALQRGVTPVRSFGPWDVYAARASLPRVFVAPRTWIVSGGLDALPPLVGSTLLDQPSLIFSEQERPDALEAALAMESLAGVVLFNSGALELAMDTLPTVFRHPLPAPGRPVALTVPSSDRYALLLRSRDHGVFPSGTLTLDGEPLDLERPSLAGAPFWIDLGAQDLLAGQHVLEGALDAAVLSEIAIVPKSIVSARRRAIEQRLASGRVPVVLVATTEQGATINSLPADQLPVTITRGQPFSDPETLDDGAQWRWMETANAPDAFAITNAGTTLVRTNVLLTVRSYDAARDLYVFLNDEQLEVRSIPAGRPTEVLLQAVELQPGANKLRLYTPFPGTPVGDRHLTFGVREGSVHAGRVRFLTSIQVPFAGAYQLEVRPYGREASVTVGSIALDSRIVELEAGDRLGEPTFSTVVDLDAGLHRVELDQQGSEQYAFRLSPLTVGSAASSERPVEVLERSPTSLTASVVTDGPAMLVFGESFDPRWTATVEGRELPHHTVNGFANGYELPGPGSYEVTLRFGPQSAFVSGAAISLASLAVIGAVAIGPAIWRRARARRSSFVVRRSSFVVRRSSAA